jgi:hypothetical protein
VFKLAGKKSVDISKKEMLELVADGLTDKEIAKKYFCSESTIQRIRSEYGIGRYVKIYNVGEYLRMKQLGLSDEEVCFVYGVSRRALNNWKYRNGLTKKYKQIHKGEDKQRKFRYKKEITIDSGETT